MNVSFAFRPRKLSDIGLAACGRFSIGPPAAAHLVCFSRRGWLRLCCSVGPVGNLQPIDNRPAPASQSRRPLGPTLDVSFAAPAALRTAPDAPDSPVSPQNP